MLLKPLTIAAGLLAAPAAAFLIPTTVSESDIHIANGIDVIAPEIAENRVVKLDCPGCPIVVQGSVKSDKSNHLELAFTIEHQLDFDRLLLNGFELYPHADPFHDILAAPQILDRRSNKHDKSTVPAHHKGPHHRRPVLPLGFGLQVHPATKDAEGVLELVSIDLQIIEVGAVFVDSIPNVEVKLIKAPGNKLLIGNIVTGTPQTAVDKQKECTTLMCKWLAIVQDRIKSLKAHRPCHGNKPAPVNGEKPKWQKIHHEHSWRMLFKNIASHILLPVLIGIVAGVSVSLIGMVVGTLIVSLWRTFFRRRSPHHHRRSHSHHKAAPKEAVVEEEKSGLMSNQAAPPAYEDDDVKTLV
ncbi:hypothetical protein B0H63DRAFT_35773 [Podospora didyma]|uniref:DUF7728 domain-containing protein n=1 Tax=Podospora didyma TaxID=330526 RepID=A0AAE0U848_9PEZI|nr:hypothetical protein B0H63DRAFT_35773 [Podospora didyma]